MIGGIRVRRHDIQLIGSQCDHVIIISLAIVMGYLQVIQMVLVVRGVLGILGGPVHQFHHRRFLCQSDERERRIERKRERERYTDDVSIKVALS
jgi:hypothetical protein